MSFCIGVYLYAYAKVFLKRSRKTYKLGLVGAAVTNNDNLLLTYTNEEEKSLRQELCKYLMNNKLNVN